MTTRRALASIVLLALPLASAPGSWTQAVEVRHEETLCLTYQARLDGAYLVVRASIQPGWHTFSMDNERRAREKLAGRQSLGIDHPTEFTLTGGLETAGPWYQTSPRDFSRPELRWFSWGFEGQATFAVKVRRRSAAPTRIAVRGQACTDTTCKNIDVEIPLPAAGAAAAGEPSGLDIKTLIAVR